MEIEKNIPMPLSRTNLPLEKMEVGDSFIYGEFSKQNRGKSSVMMNYVGKKLGRKFAQRTIEGKIRIWRIS